MQVTAKVLDDFSAHKTIRVFGIIMILNVFVSVLTDLPDFSVSTSPATTTSTSPATTTSTSPQFLLQFLLQCAQHQSLLHKLLQQRHSVPPVLVIVLGVVLLMHLVPLLILIQQNRVMKRGRRDPETVILFIIQCVISHVL